MIWFEDKYYGMVRMPQLSIPPFVASHNAIMVPGHQFAVSLLRRHHSIISAITKNRYTRSVSSQKRVHPGIKSKIHPTNTRLAKNKSYPFLRETDPDKPVNGYRAWHGFQPFLFCFLLNRWPIVYIGLHRCCFGRLFSYVLWYIFALSIFHYDVVLSLFVE